MTRAAGRLVMAGGALLAVVWACEPESGVFINNLTVERVGPTGVTFTFSVTNHTSLRWTFEKVKVTSPTGLLLGTEHAPPGSNLPTGCGCSAGCVGDLRGFDGACSHCSTACNICFFDPVPTGENSGVRRVSVDTCQNPPATGTYSFELEGILEDARKVGATATATLK